MKKAILIGTTALALAGSTLVYAQQQQRPGRDAVAERSQITADDVRAFGEARLAALKAGLALNAEQEKNWAPFASAARDLIKQRSDRFAALMARRGQPAQQGEQSTDPIARLRDRATAMSDTGAAMQKLAEAADPLYKSLDDGQKRRFAALSRMPGTGAGGLFGRGGDRRDGARSDRGQFDRREAGRDDDRFDGRRGDRFGGRGDGFDRDFRGRGDDRFGGRGERDFRGRGDERFGRREDFDRDFRGRGDERFRREDLDRDFRGRGDERFGREERFGRSERFGRRDDFDRFGGRGGDRSGRDGRFGGRDDDRFERGFRGRDRDGSERGFPDRRGFEDRFERRDRTYGGPNGGNEDL